MKDYRNNTRTILITGGAGFIGSNLLLYLIDRYPNYHFINLDILTYAGNLDNIKELMDHLRYWFIHDDICHQEIVESIFQEHNIRGVIHLAAESHVDRSILVPRDFIKTNIEGTFNLLETAKKWWMIAPNQYKRGYEDCKFLHVSTDEVYGSLGKTGFFTEESKYAPNSPYSASKASADFLVRSYHSTYGLNTVITNCSNNYGPRQHQEKLIPTIIKNALTFKEIPIYGDGKNVRDWLYVLDHCKGIDKAFHQGQVGETYIIGGRCERENIYVAKSICEVLDKIAGDFLKEKNIISYSDLITFIPDRPGHDRRYAVDPSKIENQLSWKAEVGFDEGIKRTVEWYLDNWRT